MWMALIPLLSSLIGENGPIGQFFKTKAETVKAKADFDLQVEKARIEYASKMAEAAVQQQANQLAATSQGFKFVSYALLTAPIILVTIAPVWGKDVFNNLGLIPSWYAQLYVAVVAVIWGLPVASNVVGNIFSGIQNAWADRQDKKIEKIQVMGEAQQIGKESAKKEIFDTIKKAVNLNGYNQSQVDAIGPVLDKFLQVQQNANPAAPDTVINNNK